jgi:ferredoxin
MDIQLPAVGPGSETNEEPEDDRPPATVEYLDYRAIQQQGWDVDDDDLFEKAAAADLDERQYGTMEAPRRESLLRSAEEHGLKWPFQCRSGTCAMCTGVLKDGEAEMDMNLFLEDHEVEEMDLRLTCTCQPESDTVQVVFNAIHMDFVQHIAQNRG